MYKTGRINDKIKIIHIYELRAGVYFLVFNFNVGVKKIYFLIIILF